MPLEAMSHRFDKDVMNAITAAYAVALSEGHVSYKGRLIIVQALVDEAEAGRTDPDHLVDVARIFIPPHWITR